MRARTSDPALPVICPCYAPAPVPASPCLALLCLHLPASASSWQSKPTMTCSLSCPSMMTCASITPRSRGANATMWTRREQRAQRLKQAYGDQPLPAPADAFRRQQLTSVTTTVGRKVRNSGGRLSTEQAYSALRWERCGIGTPPAQPQPQPSPSIVTSASASASPAMLASLRQRRCRSPPPLLLLLLLLLHRCRLSATPRVNLRHLRHPCHLPVQHSFQQALPSFTSELQQPSRAHLLHDALPSSIKWQVRPYHGPMGFADCAR